MADAAVGSGDEKEQEPSHRAENSSRSISGSGLSGEESRAAVAEAEDSTQNGGRCERIRSSEKPLLGAAVALEDRTCPGHGPSKISVFAAHEQLQQQQQLNDGLGVSLPKAPEDLPPKRNFQIPRKSKEKKGGSLVSFLFRLPLSFSPFLFGLHQVPPRTTACKTVSGAEEAAAFWPDDSQGARLVEITTGLAVKRLR